MESGYRKRASADEGVRSTFKLRSACDHCHRAKVRCSGGSPCAKCSREKVHCGYSAPAKVGKPKGSKNKKTIARELAMERASIRQNIEHSASVILPQSQLRNKDDGPVLASDMWLDPSLGSYQAEAVFPTGVMPENEFLLLEDNDIDHLAQLDAAAATNSLRGDFATGFGSYSTSATGSQADSNQRGFPSERFSNVTRTTTFEGNTTNPPSVALSSATFDGEDRQSASTTLENREDESDNESNDFLELLTGQRDTSIWRNGAVSAIQTSEAMSYDAFPSSPQLPFNSLSGMPQPQSRTFETENDNDLSETRCTCLLNLTSRLCELQQTEAEKPFIHLDTIQHFINRSHYALRQALSCSTCLHDVRCLQIAAVSLRTFLSWMSKVRALRDRSLTYSSGVTPNQGSDRRRQPKGVVDSTAQPIIGVRIGGYKVNKEDSAVVEIVLLSRLLSRTHTTIKLFRNRIDQASKLNNLESVSMDRLELEHLTKTSLLLAEQFKQISRQLKDQCVIEPLR